MGVPFNSSLSQVCRLVLCTLIVKSLFCLFSFLHAWANLRFVSYTLPCTGLPVPRLSLTPPLLHGVMEGTRAQKRVPSKVLSSPAVVPPSLPRRPHSLTPYLGIVAQTKPPRPLSHALLSETPTLGHHRTVTDATELWWGRRRVNTTYRESA